MVTCVFVMAQQELLIEDLPTLSLAMPFIGVTLGLVISTTLIGFGGGISASRATILTAAAVFVLCVVGILGVSAMLPKGKIVFDDNRLVVKRLILPNLAMELGDLQASIRLWERSGLYPIGITLALSDGSQTVNAALSGISLHENWARSGAASTAMLSDMRLSEHNARTFLSILETRGVPISVEVK